MSALPGERERDRVGLGTAALRAALIPLLVLGERAADTPDHSAGFWPLALVAAGYALGLLALRVAERAVARLRLPERLDRLEAAIDLGLLCALTYTSGGAFSELSRAFFLLPVLAAVRLQPSLTAAWAAVAVVAYVLVSALHPSTAEREAADQLVTHALYLAWVGVGAVLLSDVLARGRSYVDALAADRGRLAARAVEAEERERRRLAAVIHDEAVQNLLHARQELTEAAAGDRAAADRAADAVARTVESLRGEIRELHPSVLDHAGLAAALHALADEHVRRGARIDVHVDPPVAGRHDLLVHALVRELLRNAVRHAEASSIEVRVTDDHGDTVVEVRDDGRGMVPAAARDVVREGHIGLAASAERVAAHGGTFVVDSAPGRGARVRARLPPPLP